DPDDPDADGIATNTRALGYVKGSFGPASVTGAFGKQLGYKPDTGEPIDGEESAQTVLGVLASVDLGVLVPEVEYLSRDADGWDAQGTKIRAKATHNNDAFGSVYGQFITESNVDAEPLATEIEGGANLNGIGSLKARMRNEVDPATEDPTRSLLEVTGENFLDGSVFAKFSNDTDEQAEVTTMTEEGSDRSS